MAKKRTYAQEAKSIMNKYKIRLGEKFDKGDTLSLEAMNQELGALRENQEQTRVQEQQGVFGIYASGGTIEDVPKRLRGTLANMQLARNTPFMEQMIQGQNINLEAGTNAIGQPSVFPQGDAQAFDRNQNLGQRGVGGNQIPFPRNRDARKFARQAPKVADRLGIQRFSGSEQPVNQFATGGDLLPMFAGPGEDPNYIGFGNNSNYNFNDPSTYGGGVEGPLASLNYFDPATGSRSSIPGAQQEAGGGVSFQNRNKLAANRDFTALAAANTSPVNLDANVPTSIGGFQQAQAQNNLQQDFNNPVAPQQQQQEQGGDPFQFRAPWWGAAATGLGSVLGNQQLDLSEHEITAQQVAPNLVDYSREREQFGRDRDIGNQMIRKGAAGFGSRSKLMQNLQAGATGTQRVAGRQFSKSLQGEQNQNAQIKNQASQFNAQQRSITDRINNQYGRENQLINANRRTNQIAGVTGAVTGYGRDLMSANRDTGYLRLEEDEEFPIMQQNDSRLKQILGVNADPYKKFRGPNRKIKKIKT